MMWSGLISPQFATNIGSSIERRHVSWADVPRQELHSKLVEILKYKDIPVMSKNFEFAKLNLANQVPPESFVEAMLIRKASILLHLSKRQYGTEKMAKRFKRVLNRGNRVNKICKANTCHIRKAMQHLEAQGLVEIKPNGGRTLTKEGSKLVNHCAFEINRKK
ncbi:MAG: Protein component of the small (40S) ribosomal subunit [Paramarteilia canceri]